MLLRCSNPLKGAFGTKGKDAVQSEEIGAWYLIRGDESGLLLGMLYRVGINQSRALNLAELIIFSSYI